MKTQGENVKTKRNKGQLSLEFLIVTSLVLLVLIVMGMVVFQKYSEWSALRLHVTGRNIANNLADGINEISIVGHGYSQYVNLYVRYPGDDFNVTFKKGNPIVFVEQEMTWHAPLLTSEVYCCTSLCSVEGDKTMMHINATQAMRIINYRNRIYLGMICGP
jgi:hypothetical protein